VLTNTLDRENVTSYNLAVTFQDTPDDGTPNQATYMVTHYNITTYYHYATYADHN